MTEQEAAGKWCPFARLPQAQDDSTTPAVNRQWDGEMDMTATCLGSLCMAWRWNERHQTELDGYCGLAGKP